MVASQPRGFHCPSGRRRVKRTRASIESIGTDLSCLRGAKRTYNTSCVVLHSYLTPMVRTCYRVAAAVNFHAIPSPPQLSSAPTRVGCPSPCSKDLQQTLHTSVRRGDGQMCTMPMVLKCAFKHVWQPEFCTAHCGAYCFTRTVAVGWHPLKKMRHRARLLTRVFAGAFVRRCFTRTVALRLASVSKWEHRFSGGHLPYKD